MHSAWCLSRRSARAYKMLVSTTITKSAGYRPKPSPSSSSARSDTSVLPLSPIPANAGKRRDPRWPGSSPASGPSSPRAHEDCSSPNPATSCCNCSLAVTCSVYAGRSDIAEANSPPTGRSRDRRPSTQWLWLTCPASPLEPLGPTQGSARQLNFFRIMSLSCGAPLRNRTVDLLLTMSTVPDAVRASCTDSTARRSDSSRRPGIIRPAGPRAVPRWSLCSVTVRVRIPGSHDQPVLCLIC